MKRLSIIIVTYHSEKDIYDCLASVYEHCDIDRKELEVIIVDNSQECEPMFTRLKQLYGDDVILTHNTHNGGYGQGNNVGIRRATAPVIMIMNPDVRLCQPVFRHCLAEFDRNPRLVLYGFTQRQANGTIGHSAAWVNTVHPYIAEPLRFVMGKMNLFWPRFMYVTGACFFMRKESFAKAGLFDESIFMYGEEEDIRDRLMKLPGAQMGYDRRLSYLHLHPVPTDMSKETHDWMKGALSTMLKINRRNGIADRRTICYAIKRNNISIWKEQLKSLLTGGRNSDRLDYFRQWKRYLLSLDMTRG